MTNSKGCDQALDLCEGKPAKAVNFRNCESLIDESTRIKYEVVSLMCML